MLYITIAFLVSGAAAISLFLWLMRESHTHKSKLQTGDIITVWEMIGMLLIATIILGVADLILEIIHIL